MILQALNKFTLFLSEVVLLPRMEACSPPLFLLKPAIHFLFCTKYYRWSDSTNISQGTSLCRSRWTGKQNFPFCTNHDSMKCVWTALLGINMHGKLLKYPTCNGKLTHKYGWVLDSKNGFSEITNVHFQWKALSRVIRPGTWGYN